MSEQNGKIRRRGIKREGWTKMRRIRRGGTWRKPGREDGGEEE